MPSTTKVSFVYFDVGGVAIKDFSASSKWEQMKRDMGLPLSRWNEYEDYYNTLEPELCLAKFDLDNLMPDIENKFGFHFPPGFSMLSYFVDHFDKNSTLTPIISRLQASQVGLGLLTDQYLRLLDLIFSRKLLNRQDYRVIVDSTEIKIKKPNPAVYQLAEGYAGVPADQILFIDNKASNLDVPQKLGWQTFFYDSHDCAASSGKLDEYLSRVLLLAD